MQGRISKLQQPCEDLDSSGRGRYQMSEMCDVVVVGGSITGLMHGVVLQSLGRKVTILESRKPKQLRAQAAGLSLGPDAQELLRIYVPSEEPFAFDTSVTQILDIQGNVMNEIPPAISVVTSSWSVVFEKLKKKFDQSALDDGNSAYIMGARVFKIQDREDLVTISYHVEDDERTEVVHAKLVIASDGFRSSIRTQLLPEVQPKYAGYLAWRGSLPESMACPEVSGALDGKLVMTLVKDSYILGYVTPGPSGTTNKGNRLLEWCWYDYCEGSSFDFAELMTDASGHRHQQTVPRGSLSQKAYERLIDRSEVILPSFWKGIVQNTNFTSSFVTAITSFEGSRASFYGGKILLVGEAFTQFRPHLGLGSNLGAFQALALIDVVKGQSTVENWEKRVAEYALEIASRSSATGHFGMTGRWPEGYVPPYLRKSAESLPSPY